MVRLSKVQSQAIRICKTGRLCNLKNQHSKSDKKSQLQYATGGNKYKIFITNNKKTYFSTKTSEKILKHILAFSFDRQYIYLTCERNNDNCDTELG